MNNIATIADYEKIATIISDGKEVCGSGCFVWSDEQTSLYCVTAYHCIKDNEKTFLTAIIEGERVSIDQNKINLIAKCEENDIAIYKIDEDPYLTQIPNTLIGDLNETPEKLVINGFPDVASGNLVQLIADFQSSNSTKFNFSVPSLDAYNVNRLGEVIGISGSGCYVVEGNTLKLIGIETNAINENVTFKTLKGTTITEINRLLKESKHPMLARPTPSYVTKKIGAYQVVEDALKLQIFQNKWADLDISLTIKNCVESFLNDNEVSLYLCGSSGIGKTRGVLQNCFICERKYAIYYDNYGNFKHEQQRFIEYIINIKGRIVVIIDEVKLEEYNDINNKFNYYKDKICFILIGTISKTQQSRGSQLLCLEEVHETDISRVISEEYPTFDQQEISEIYHLSHNDLRLATLIARLYAKDKISTVPLCPLIGSATKIMDKFSSADSILKTTMKQHHETVPSELDVEKYFNRLSLFVDIGYRQNVDYEIKALADFFSDDVSHFKATIDYFIAINLGIQKQNYFELSPRALAKLAFEQKGWGLIKYKLNDFIDSIPSELLRKRFYDRGDECHLQEVREGLSSCFQKIYYTGELGTLTRENASKIMMYIEHCPDIGVPWLKNIVLSASSDDIMSFTASHGRRNVVWTCEHLANFKEYFFDCEEILFILAQNENEFGISNNSQGTWSDLFSPILSNTEVDFYKRFLLLLKRLEEFNHELKIEVYSSALSSALNIGSGSRLCPPAMVGGRITPEHWQPETVEEMVNIQKFSLEKLSEFYNKQIDCVNKIILEVLSNHIYDFLSPQVFHDFKLVMEKMLESEQEKRGFIIKLERQITFLENYKYDNSTLQTELKNWILELTDDSREGRLYEFLAHRAKNYGYEREQEEIWLNELHAHAESLLKTDSDSEILENICLSSEFNEIVVEKLMTSLGEKDSEQKMILFFEQLLNRSEKHDLVLSYFIGIYSQKNMLPTEVSLILERHQETSATFVLTATTIMNISEEGFQQIMLLIPKVNNKESVSNMRCKIWCDFLKNKQKLELLKLIISLQYANKYCLCFDLIAGWSHFGQLSESICDFSIETFKNCIDTNGAFQAFYIEHVFSNFPEQFHPRIIEVLLSIFDFNEPFLAINKPILNTVFSFKNEKTEPQIIECFGNSLIASENSMKSQAMKGFFNMFTTQNMLNWINVDREKRAHLIAYHLDSPSINNNEISNLTASVLENFNTKKVSNAYLLGAWNFQAAIPRDYFNNQDEWFTLLNKYKSSNIQILNKWALETEMRIIDICKSYEDQIYEDMRYNN